MGIAIVNGKCLDQDHVSVRNLLIKNAAITGVGYIPDEDEEQLNIVDITQSLMLANTFDFVYSPMINQLSSFIESLKNNGLFNCALLPNKQTTVLDDPSTIQTIKAQLPTDHSVQIVASASKGDLPDALSELSLLHQAGAQAIYLGRIIENEKLLIQALTYIDMIGCPIVVGPLTKLMAGDSHLNEGTISFEIGIRGEALAEEVRLLEWLLSLIQQYTRVPVHFLAVSSARSIKMIAEFKKIYPDVSVGVSPYHCCLSDQLLSEYNSQLKFNPPLRSQSDMAELMASVVAGVDHFTSLHAPKTNESQPVSFFDAMPYTQTLGSFYPLISHICITHSIELPRLASLLAGPKPFRGYPQNELNLNDNASFVALKTTSDNSTQTTLFQDIIFDLEGGVDKIMVQGSLL